MAAVRRLQLCAVSPAGTHSASVIFLHGSGDTGQGLRSWVRDILTPDLAFSHIRVIYPTAPVRPYTPMRGALSTVWFDRYKISRDCPEHLESIDTMCSSLGAVIQEEVWSHLAELVHVCEQQPDGPAIGLSLVFMEVTGWVVLEWGFSMGGAMALHLACRYHPDVAGVFALSSFLNKDSAAFQATEDRFHRGLPLPELFQCHGSTDELVLPAWGEETSALLRKAGMSTLFYSFPGLSHQLSPPEMEMLRSWILQKLPPAGPS
ncbi:Lysophospholipase-like protein 1 [Takifugu flavidus]|uniref:palmitoyl-protein hydrolase n=1 Tax=Takifugu flavidus TaxID=433684 RepID=A0A5C6PJG5_9TELE|nr:Lysophospholipase-like protein 1 [Takifugu flavidus]